MPRPYHGAAFSRRRHADGRCRWNIGAHSRRRSGDDETIAATTKRGVACYAPTNAAASHSRAAGRIARRTKPRPYFTSRAKSVTLHGPTVSVSEMPFTGASSIVTLGGLPGSL